MAPRKRTHGTSSVIDRPNGRKQALFTDPRTGRRRSLGTFDTRKQAEAAAREGS